MEKYNNNGFSYQPVLDSLDRRLCINCKHYVENSTLTVKLFPTDEDGFDFEFKNYCDKWQNKIPNEETGKAYCWKFEDKDGKLCVNCEHYRDEYMCGYNKIQKHFCLLWKDSIPCFDGVRDNMDGAYCSEFKKKEEECL